MVKPPTEKKKGKWADWKQKAWASDAFIAKEYPKKKDPDQDWETYSRHYQAYPGHCIDTEQATLDTIAKTITSELELDRIVEAWRFHDEVFQKPINHMALACGKFQEPPLLLVHGPRSSVYDDAKNDLIGAAVQIPGYIDINEASRKYFLQPEHKIQFKAVMAHELAHLALGHCKAENIALSRTKPMDTEWEIRADLMGAVIYGNPKKYAKAINTESGRDTAGTTFPAMVRPACCINGRIALKNTVGPKQAIHGTTAGAPSTPKGTWFLILTGRGS